MYGPWYNGWLAYHQEKLVTENPFHKPSEPNDWEGWDCGWKDAEAEELWEFAKKC
jgi:hypothetical protein